MIFFSLPKHTHTIVLVIFFQQILSSYMRCVNFICALICCYCGSRVSFVVGCWFPLFGVNALQFISKACAITAHLTSSHFVSMLLLSVTFNFIFFPSEFAIINYYLKCIETKLQQNHFSSSHVY